MYSIVLMAALTTGGDAVGWFCPTSCGNAAGWFHHKHDGPGVHTLYKTVGCYGCYGGWGGCWGKGDCWGGSCYGAITVWGGGWGAWGGWLSGGGPWSGSPGYSGSCGYSGSTGPVQGMPSGSVMPGAPAASAALTAPATPATATGSRVPGLSPSRARVIVELPAGARLYVEDQVVNITSRRPVFSTPELDPGKVYYYEMRVEFQRDGQTYRDTRRVELRSGQEVVQSFTNLGKRTSNGTITADARSQP